MYSSELPNQTLGRYNHSTLIVGRVPGHKQLALVDNTARKRTVPIAWEHTR